ncbi:hypothetical protein BHE74_00019896 [Ensete ventricosum]|nr:hypothetical protein BHE74_00019896 [Ensete ventricosum]
MRCALREEFVFPLLFPLDHFSFMDTGEYECDDQMVTRALPQRQVDETVVHTILIEAFEHRWRQTPEPAAALKPRQLTPSLPGGVIPAAVDCSAGGAVDDGGGDEFEGGIISAASGAADFPRGSAQAESGKSELPRSAMAASSCALAAISGFGDVPSRMRSFLRVSRTSHTHRPPPLRSRTPWYTGCRVSRNFFRFGVGRLHDEAEEEEEEEAILSCCRRIFRR